MKVKEFKTKDNDVYYISENSNYTIRREFTGASPNGNPFNGKWVLRINCNYIDASIYRFDLFEQYNIKVIEDES